jgi:hypothetical protein
MATEKQIAANRANSKRSTGPKTKLGRLKSSRNAFRHGLSSTLPMNPPGIESIAQALTTAAGEHLSAARELAQTELELLRVRHVRGDMIASLLKCWEPRQIRHLAALGRYERCALAKRKRAEGRLGFSEAEQ